ncbi:MAG: DUF4123 domain-containing protein [Polyangiaceae bacterium]|nr:DUF4123 domain-containing protein [Polyangiaceae bacterium]
MTRLIVEIRGGMRHGEKVVLPPGNQVRFGRTDLADVVIAHDDQMSGVHFDISWDGKTAFLRDKNSLLGTLLNGLPIVKSVVPHGGWIRAGRTDIMVYIENFSQMNASKNADPDPDLPIFDDEPSADAIAEEPPPEAVQALQFLRAESARKPLYTIVDTARSEAILPMLRESVERHQSLYEGAEGDALSDVAPYLVGPMLADSPLLSRLVENGWGKRWGIYFTSSSPFREVRRHFRRFLMIELEESSERVYFRFYDPLVFSDFWEVANPQQKRALGENIEFIFLPSDAESGAPPSQPERRRS